MVALRFVLTGFAAVAAVSASLGKEHLFAALLKRQEPGTPAYNCHDNCGTAITISKASSNVCSNVAFLTNYANCLQCSGPDNYNIWRYYSSTLSTVGAGCGLETEPLSGEQPDVPPATPAGGSPSSALEPAPTPEASVPTTDAPVPTHGPESSAYETVVPTPTFIDTVISSIPVSLTRFSSYSGIPTPSSNGTVSFTSSPPQQTTNAAGHLDIGTGIFGAVVLGMMYGLGN